MLLSISVDIWVEHNFTPLHCLLQGQNGSLPGSFGCSYGNHMPSTF
ncbi:hypothetical protein CXB51_034393 [Gossypium anomalum]|uniref:Uncharacterized protein n=1 Tax=Gossypium anomalum TaxID=47600 RepID=A0A8J6CLX1_9ROSI|nr:hypothetical protein CXB51_034393 [Gossypium anomalum]